MKWLVLVLALTCSACALFNDSVDIESDTSWTGDFNGHTVDGYGNQSVGMGLHTSGSHKCAFVHKNTARGRLKASLSGYLVTTPSNESETTAAYGWVRVCT